MTRKELQERQAWTLAQKIDPSLGVIDQFVSRLHGKAYVAFSGGKDSTVLLHLARIIKPDIPAVFVNTGNEYPEIVKFVRDINNTWGGVITLHPKKTAKQVWEEYGFPIGSKAISKKVSTMRNCPEGMTYEKALHQESRYALRQRWHYLLKAPYDVSAKCCDELKKKPSNQYSKETGRRPIIGIMADDSDLRETTYLRRSACNVFGDKDGNTSSWPLAIWVEEDIWRYIRENKIPYCDIYDKGVSRTGCVACGFGAGEARDDRMRVLYDLHPKYYDMIMQFKNNGVPYRKALRDMFYQYRRYLPDECPL